MTDPSKPLISPGMKVAALLDAWPELEEVLIAQAPEFRKLRNPILRRTVAKVATLEQAAGIAGIAPRDLVMALRKAAGQPVDGAAGTAAPPGAADEATPQWFDPAKVVRTIDADAMLAAGQVPLHAVFAAAASLAPGDILEVTAGFRPVPLLESLQKQGRLCFVHTSAPGRFHLYVTPDSRP
jgi:hypothetical protein